MTKRIKLRRPFAFRRNRDAYQALVNFSTLLLCFCLSAAISSRRAFGVSPALFQQSIQQSRDTGGVAVDEKDVRALESGKQIRRELGVGQEHTYRIELKADQFLKVIVEQQWIDITAHVSGPDGNKILEFDSESRLLGREEVSLVAEAVGGFLLTVRSKPNGSSAGSYEIRIEELRAATDTDRALHDARKQYEEASRLGSAGNYDEALRLAARALETRERLLGAEHPDVAAALYSLGYFYTDKGEYDKVEPLYQRALAIYEKARDKDPLNTANILNDLGALYYYQGKYGEAERFYKRALDVLEKAFDKGLTSAEIFNNLATVYVAQGKYVEAEPLHRRALDIREKALGKNHLNTAQSLSNLALVYDYQGKYEEAEPLYKRALDIREMALGKDHPTTSVTLNNLASLYYSQEKYEQAEPLYRRSLDIREKALGKDHPSTATGLNNLAFIYSLKGKYEEAETLYKRVLDIRERALGKDHPDTCVSLSNLGKLYFARAKYGEAEQLYKRALDISERTLGKDHPFTAIVLENLAILYTAKFDLVQAVKFQSMANTANERNVVYNLATGSERDKLAYLKTLPEQTDRTISLHIDSTPNDPAARNLAATMILQRKGRALDATSQDLNALRRRFNAEDRALLDRLTETRSQIARLALRGPQKMSVEQHQARIKELEEQAEKDEADISRVSKEFFAQSLPVTLEAVREAIPDDSALIEFATYRPFNARTKDYGQPRYVAYVLRHGGEIQFTELGDAKAIDEAIVSLRNALRDPRSANMERLARGVDEKVFQPVRPLLGAKRRLLISPDGSLNLIPFEALVDERRRYAVEHYSISYLTSGRDLLRLQVARESKDGPLVVAAPDFGRRRDSEGEVKARSDVSAINDFYFPPLPAAEREGEALRALLPGATLLTEGKATKAALSQIHGPRLLHIATHGFFLEDQDFIPAGGRGARGFSDDPNRALVQLEQRGVRVESPLLRSGLVLAGANEHKEDDNGILTALEVTGLNLWGTKLVTLSACDTGLGEVKNGDGVYGLRRALVLAGAETQIMSLWSVSDRATQELMVSYYQRLRQGQGRGDALRQAQLEMLKKENRRHPYYWGCFIQSGEWANLDGKR
jgi:CHAT domain-containing protein/Tfp pilus assembly protein PilF